MALSSKNGDLTFYRVCGIFLRNAFWKVCINPLNPFGQYRSSVLISKNRQYVVDGELH